MNALHALGAERGAELKKMAENTILRAVVTELETSKVFDTAQLDRVLDELKRERPDMQDVLDIHVSLDDTRIRSSLLAREDTANINLDASDLAQIETKGATVDTVEGQNATAIVIKYLVSLATPKQIEPPDVDYETTLNNGSIPFPLWKILVAQNIYVMDAIVTVVEKGQRLSLIHTPSPRDS
jgi:hypothetical protein